MHYGVGHLDGGHSGRYPWGSGKNPGSDVSMLKTITDKNINKARELSNQASKRTRRRLIIDTGMEKSKDWANIKNRDKFEQAIRMRYKTDYVFRKAVKEAKQKWKDIEKENNEAVDDFIKYYKNSNVKNNPINNKETMDFIKRFSSEPYNYTSLSDIDFAVKILFDDQLSTNKKNIGVENRAKAKEVAQNTAKGVRKVGRGVNKAGHTADKLIKIGSTLSRYI